MVTTSQLLRSVWTHVEEQNLPSLPSWLTAPVPSVIRRRCRWRGPKGAYPTPSQGSVVHPHGTAACGRKGEQTKCFNILLHGTDSRLAKKNMCFYSTENAPVGKFYAVGERIPEVSKINSCRQGCFCSQHGDENPTIVCASVDCAYSPKFSWDTCRPQYDNLNQCCMGIIVILDNSQICNVACC